MARIPRTKIGKKIGEAVDNAGCVVFIVIMVLIPLLTSILVVEGVR